MKYLIIPTMIFFHKLDVVVFANDQKTKIVGGEPVSYGRYPYQVAMLDQYGSLTCGGSLVDEFWVLSAAHCKGYATSVQIGRHDLTDESEYYESIDIEWETKHPDYDSTTSDNDFMMVKLKNASKYSLVSLDDGYVELDDGDNVTVMGWGTTTEGGELSDILLEVEVDIVDNDACDVIYDGFITDNMLCAAREGKDSCQGDSGGPLIIKGNYYDSSEDIQVGVVSWGTGCAQAEYPGVYARVSEQYEWIMNEIESGTEPDDDYFFEIDGWFVLILNLVSLCLG